MKILRVGDPHAMVRNLKEMNSLIEFVKVKGKEHKVDRIEFMGDNFHTHAVIRVEVLNFWMEAFSTLREDFDVLTLVGNHDQPGSRENEDKMNALQLFESMDVYVIDRPMIFNGIAYMPYTSDHTHFTTSVTDMFNNGATKCLVAHQTFTGATYENGFYAEDGIEPELVPQEQILSGHIHKQQQIGKCFYLGTPKWDTMSDANEDKGIWIFEHNIDGSVKNREFISTADVVTPIIKYVVNEGEEVPELNPNARTYLEFHGKSAWVSKMKKKYKGKASIKAKPTDRKVQKLNEEKTLSLVDYLNKHFEPVDGVSRTDINSYLKEVANV